MKITFSETKLEQPVFIVATILMDRFTKATDIVMDSNIAHKLFLVSLHMAQKYQCDKAIANKFMAHVSGVSEKYLRELEIKYFKTLGWNLVVHKREFDKYRREFKQLAHSMSSEKGSLESKN